MLNFWHTYELSSHNSLSELSSLLFLLSLLSPDGCDPAMVLVRRWFWFGSRGPIVMGPMWFDGLPLFSVLCSLFSVLSSWVCVDRRSRGSECEFLVWSVDRSSRERGSKGGSDCSWVILRRVPLL